MKTFYWSLVLMMLLPSMLLVIRSYAIAKHGIHTKHGEGK